MCVYVQLQGWGEVGFLFAMASSLKPVCVRVLIELEDCLEIQVSLHLCIFHRLCACMHCLAV